jgi:hypothetical protein
MIAMIPTDTFATCSRKAITRGSTPSGIDYQMPPSSKRRLIDTWHKLARDHRTIISLMESVESTAVRPSLRAISTETVDFPPLYLRRIKV